MGQTYVLKSSAGANALILGVGVSGKTLGSGGPPPGTASITINEDRSSWLDCAPYSSIFSATVSGFNRTGSAPTEYDDRLTELHYYWDFGGLDEYQFTAPTNIYSGSAKHTGGHKNARYAYGPMAQHTFRTVGTHTVTLTVYEEDSGIFGTGTLQITVTNPDTQFSGTNTIYVDPAGSFSNAPAGCRQVTSSNLSAQIASWGRGQDSTPKRFMLARGESFTCGPVSLGVFTSPTPTLHIVAESGAGADPIVTPTGTDLFDYKDDGSATTQQKDFVCQNISFQGNYNPAGPSGTTGIFMNPREGSPNLFVFDGCTINGFGVAILDLTTGPVGFGYGAIFNDTVITNHSYGGLMGDEAYFCFTGSRISDPADVYINGTNGANGWGFRHEPSGTNSGSKRLYQNSDFYIHKGWSGLATQIAIATQAPIRLYTRSGHIDTITANNLEGGYDLINSNPASGSTQIVNRVISNNYFLGCYGTNSYVALQDGGNVIRDNIFVLPARVAGGQDANDTFFAYLQSTSGGNSNAPLLSYCNTFVNDDTLEKGGSRLTLHVVSGGGSWTIANNVEHQPAGSYTVDAPLGDDTNLFTPRTTGYLSTTVDYRSTTATVSTAGVTDFRDPETGSAAIGDEQAGNYSDCDFRGVRRADVLFGLSRSVGSRGAWEPSLES